MCEKDIFFINSLVRVCYNLDLFKIYFMYINESIYVCMNVCMYVYIHMYHICTCLVFVKVRKG